VPHQKIDKIKYENSKGVRKLQIHHNLELSHCMVLASILLNYIQNKFNKLPLASPSSEKDGAAVAAAAQAAAGAGAADAGATY
jgi:hypothetical protein